MQAVERCNAQQPGRQGDQGHCPEQRQRTEHDRRQRPRAQPVRPPAPGRTSCAGQRKADDGQWDHRRGHPPVLGHQREVLLQAVEPPDQRCRDHRSTDHRRGGRFPDARTKHVEVAATAGVLPLDPGRLGQPAREKRGRQADPDADPADQLVTPNREEKRRRPGGRDLAQQRQRVDPPVYAGVVLLRAPLDQPFVKQRLVGAGNQGAPEAPQDEPGGKGHKARKHDPRQKAHRLEQARCDQCRPAGEPVGQGARRYLGNDGRGRPEHEQHRDFCVGQPGVGEEQRVDRVERHGVGERCPTDYKPAKPACFGV